MRKPYAGVLAGLVAAACSPALRAQLPDLAPVIRGLDRPTAIAAPHDGSGRLFVTQQGGVLAVFDGSNGDQPRPTPVLTVEPACCGERGLLGVAFHPNFEENGYFYINYTRPSDTATVVARYQLSPPSSNVADPGTAKEILVIPQLDVQHKAGDLHFGPDGFLYIATGDGGFREPPPMTSQDPESLLGKILRIDVDGGDPYAVPADNPSGNEVWAMGLRNPWRFSFDRRNGDLIVADVGWGDREEINVIPNGVDRVMNFGWPLREGDICWRDCDTPGLSEAVIVHGHGGSEGIASITGGYTYRGSKHPQFQGRYFYADFVSGGLWLVDEQSSFGPLPTGLAICAFGEDEEGELYLADYASGTVFAITAAEADSQNPRVSAVVNAATFDPDAPIAPGSIVTLYSSNLGFNRGLSLFPAESFGEVGVTINGRPAPLFDVVPDQAQINLLAPRDLPTSGEARIVVRVGELTSEEFRAPLAPVAPGIFPIFDPADSRVIYAAATLADSAWVPVPDAVSERLGLPVECEANGFNRTSFCGRPARAGDILQLFVTGLGRATVGGAVDGAELETDRVAPGSGDPLYQTVETPIVLVGGREATVWFSGLAPGFAGLYQVNFTMPAGVAPGDDVPLRVVGAAGVADVKLIAVAPN